MSTPLKAADLLGRLFRFGVIAALPVEPDPIPTLWRVEMWCGRHWIEARDAGLAAMAVGDLNGYIGFRADEQEWFHALMLVNKLYVETQTIERVSKEHDTHS